MTNAEPKRYPSNPEGMRQFNADMARRDKEQEQRDHAAKMKIRNGVRLILQGIEELWRLPRSFETKGEQGRR